MGLDAILEWEMTEFEAKVFKICLMWESIINKELPNYRTTRLPKRGDPRKSLLFKHCRKMAMQLNGIVPDNEIKLYIFAQIFILKNLRQGKVHAMIEPACLCGENAWKRWLVFRNKFNRQLKETKLLGITEDIVASNSGINAELEKTKTFLQTQGVKNSSDLELKIREQELLKWVAFSKVSPYFIILYNEFKNRWQDLEDAFSFDPGIYKKEITGDLKNVFKSKFAFLI